MSKPDLWPKNPYPIEIFPMTIDEYIEQIPDPILRTAISGYLGRLFWNIASETIWEKINEAIENGKL